MSKLRDVGLDVHKDTIVMAVAEEGQGEAKVLGTFPHDVAKLIKRLIKLEPDVSRLRVLLRGGADRVWVVSAIEEGGDRLPRGRAVAGASAGVAGEDGSAGCSAVGSLSAVGGFDGGLGSR